MEQAKQREAIGFGYKTDWSTMACPRCKEFNASNKEYCQTCRIELQNNPSKINFRVKKGGN